MDDHHPPFDRIVARRREMVMAVRGLFPASAPCLRPSLRKGLHRRTWGRDGCPSPIEVRHRRTWARNGRGGGGSGRGRAVDHAALWICGQAPVEGVELSSTDEPVRYCWPDRARLTTSSTSLGRLGRAPPAHMVHSPDDYESDGSKEKKGRKSGGIASLAPGRGSGDIASLAPGRGSGGIASLAPGRGSGGIADARPGRDGGITALGRVPRCVRGA